MSKIYYEFQLENGESVEFEVDPEKALQEPGPEARHENWTKLGFHQCPNCPLSIRNCKFCPAAVDIEALVEKFQDVLSHQKAIVKVTTRERTYLKECDVQTGLKSLLGLILASGHCPVLSQLKPMAFYHLPFATIQETLYRVVGAYMVKQYFRKKEGEDTDLELKGLKAFYEELQAVNTHFMSRLQNAFKGDANLNALNVLFSLSVIVSMSLKDELEEMKPFFEGGLNILKKEDCLSAVFSK